MSTPRAAIVGLGSVRGAIERPNAWWPRDLVESWRPGLAARKKDLAQALANESRPARRKIMELMVETADDPFNGIDTRPIHDPTVPVAQFEASAARIALEQANVDPTAVDLLVTHSFLPDMLATNVATSVHHALGLRPDCLCFGMEGASNSFSHQLTIAQAMLSQGRARVALLVQSTTANRLLPRELPYSPWFGDVATAAVVKLTSDGTGIIEIVHTTDGSVQGSLLAGAPGRPWHEGPSILYPGNANIVFFRTLESCQEVGDALFTKTGLQRSQVDFYGCHLAFKWLTPVTRDALGLGHTRGVDVFAQTGNLVSCGLVYQMAHAQRTGAVKHGDMCVFWSGGAGITNSGIAVRWSMP